MKHVLPNKERGVVMILILVFLTMFAIMISAFLFMTSNMSDSAANSLALYEKGETAQERSSADIDSAIRTLVVGTNNEASPIGPFGILENLYGEQPTLTTAGDKLYDPLAVKLFNIYGEFDPDNGAPTKAVVDIYLDGTSDYAYYNDEDNNRKWFSAEIMGECLSDFYIKGVDLTGGDRLLRKKSENNSIKDPAEVVAEYILNSGTVISFGSIQWKEREQVTGLPKLYCDVCRSYKDHVSGTTAPIIKRMLVNDSTRGLKILKVEVALTEGLKNFLPTLAQFHLAQDAAGWERQWPFFSYDQMFELSANLRFNPRPFSGTGAGGAMPNDALDGQVAPFDNSTSSSLVEDNNEVINKLFFPEDEDEAAPFRLPFAFWANAAAPDLAPCFDSDGILSFQTYWRHLSDSKYRVYTPQGKDAIYPLFNGNKWEPPVVAETTLPASILLNPSYTAPDNRTLFLAALNPDDGTAKEPSFMRTSTLQKIYNHYMNPSADVTMVEGARLPALLRKVTPRPLRIDHWGWAGGIDSFTPSHYGMGSDPATITEKTVAELEMLLGNDKDVDNDNNGKKEGIWIPSGLPVRVDENGTPYATMYSFTVLDMDGRVNVNTAGNWDQFADLKNYSSVTDLNNSNSPWFTFENLGNGIRWKDDENKDITTKVKRGTGLGPAGVDLSVAFEQISQNNPGTQLDKAAAQRILRARWLSNDFADLSPEKTLPAPDGPPLFDGTGENPNEQYPPDSGNLLIALRGQLAQPSAYYDKSGERTDPSQWNLDDSDLHRRFYLYTDAIYRNRNDETAETKPELFLFPWRGKTRVFNYNVPYNLYPTFDFCDTALRSYDPLGNDILTYLPKYGENPYLVNPYGSSIKDSTFTAEALELLLRPFDYDRKIRNTALLEALQGNDDAVNHPEDPKFRALRQEITTISSDIPVPASTFSVGTKEVHDTVSGLRELIRRCVVLEIYKANKDNFGTAYIDEKRDFFKGIANGEECDEWRSQFRAYLREWIEEDIKEFDSAVPTAYSSGRKNKNAVDAITDQLFSMLPLDIREGRRLDLNALSHKACWIDSVYQDQGNGTYVRTKSDGDVDDVTREEFEYYHQLGLAERMKFARGLYVLLMVLTYEDRNAETVHDFYDNDPSAPLSEYTYEDYLEGYLEPESSESESERGNKELAAELMANRLAQYCINLVDFSDPDATMTPFFYDPNPFDGWWSYRGEDNDGLTNSTQKLDFVLYTPGTDPNGEDRDFYDALIPEVDRETNEIKDESSFLSTPDAPISSRCYDSYINSDLPVKFANPDDTYSQALIAWLNGQSVDNTGVGEDDFGMRLVWGMERPDLLLTETLAFHDLGIADTPLGNRQGEDEDFDQVRRPLGSAYLELYCAANPNVPQSPELYKFDEERNLWKLELSKMTKRQKEDSPYAGKEFPIWRVAISAPTDPRDRNKADDNTKIELKNKTADDFFLPRKINKKKNSTVERLVGDDADINTFSFRTRQFCDLTFDADGKKWADENLKRAWRNCDYYTTSSILGPCAKMTDSGAASGNNIDLTNEIEIDRIVWFGWPTKTNNSDLDVIGSFPDAAHIFSRVRETKNETLETEIFPNQYLVVAPAKKRHIGSLLGYDYFGYPSNYSINLAKLRKANSGKWTNSDYVLVSNCNGLDLNDKDQKIEVNKRGLNISEPLWTEETDPYLYAFQDAKMPGDITKPVDYDGEKIEVTAFPRMSPESDYNPQGEVQKLEHPFERPTGNGFSNPRNDQYPIAEDHLMGLGTVPGIRSAFVQRVADPNRPYHPFANPYISVDWNMMDLTVFNGERKDSGYSQTEKLFYTSDENGNNAEREVDDENHLLLPNSNSVFTINNSEFNTDVAHTDSVKNTSVFSSRCWLNRKQKGFLPYDLRNDHRPNPWARPLRLDEEGGLKNENAGLWTKQQQKELCVPIIGINNNEEEKTDLLYRDITDIYEQFSASGIQECAVQIFPRHSLGAYNDVEHRITDLDDQFVGAADAEKLRQLYYGMPKHYESNDPSDPGDPKQDSDLQPFEHLVWNDAPFNSPMEMLLVPASAPGRFGLEFIRKSGSPINLSAGNTENTGEDEEGGESEGDEKTNASLGSDTGESSSNFCGWNSLENGKLPGPYLNFHHSSDIKGKSLNLGNIFDFVTIPSLYMGTRLFSGYDQNLDPVYTPTLREPGKINLNTISGTKDKPNPGLAGIVGKDFDFGNFYNEYDKSWFQPAQTALLKAELGFGDDDTDADSSDEKNPGNSTLLRENLADSKGGNNMLTATEELRKLAGLTTNRSNVFAVWLTVGYFEVERARPGVNMPSFDPDGNPIPVTADGYLNLTQDYKYSEYYKVIYPDGYTYGKELGTDGVDTDGISRPRAFYLIDRSIPVDFRRGRSWNWKNVILLERKL